MTDIRANLGSQRLAGEVKRHRHRWDVPPVPAAMEDGDWRVGCRCGARQDLAATRKGRTNRARGNAYERRVAGRLGLKRVGQFGGVDDARGWMTVQIKNGGAFPELLWRWLEALPRDDRLRAVVVGDAPGSGTKRREVIVLDFEDFCRWFGR